MGKPAKFSRHILEAEIKEGGMKLHNMEHYNHALKLSWLKRLLSSQGKWKYLVSEDFDNVFTYGAGYLDGLTKVTTIPFWKEVIIALKHLWKSDIVPVWYNPNFRLQIVPEWNKKKVLRQSETFELK